MNQRFNPPPNWPAPPPGWTPPPGWLPDPAWGPPPAGWQLWVDAPTYANGIGYVPEVRGIQWAGDVTYPQKRRGRVVWLVVLAIVVALFAGCAVILSSSGSPESQLNSKSGGSVSQEQIDAAPELTERDLALLVKSPDSHTGKTIVLYARITQFDAATGECTFRANISYKKMNNSYEYDQNSVFRGDGKTSCQALSGFVTDDEVRITATSLGSISYDTQIGGRTTVPAFKVEKIASVK